MAYERSKIERMESVLYNEMWFISYRKFAGN